MKISTFEPGLKMSSFFLPLFAYQRESTGTSVSQSRASETRGCELKRYLRFWERAVNPMRGTIVLGNWGKFLIRSPHSRTFGHNDLIWFWELHHQISGGGLWIIRITEAGSMSKQSASESTSGYFLNHVIKWKSVVIMSVANFIMDAGVSLVFVQNSMLVVISE